jgi:large subunit ribosomal protein L23
MKNIHILKSPKITEKSNVLMETGNKFVFEVCNDSTKGQIKEAVEALYGVKVINVNTLSNAGKLKKSWSNRRFSYNSKKTKKAIVQLDPKDTLKLYEGGKND